MKLVRKLGDVIIHGLFDHMQIFYRMYTFSSAPRYLDMIVLVQQNVCHRETETRTKPYTI